MIDWYSLAVTHFPQHRWALNEILYTGSLDAMCVELEVITGDSAAAMRLALLQFVQRNADATAPGSRTEQVWQFDPRIAKWVVLQSFLVVSKKLDTSFGPTMLSTMAMGRILRGTGVDVDTQLVKRVADSTLPYASTGAGYMRLAIRALAKSIVFNDAKEAVNAVYCMMNAMTYTMFREDSIALLKDTIDASILTVPVVE